MPFLHEHLSIVEVIALVEAGILALGIVIAIIANIPGVLRYIRISSK